MVDDALATRMNEELREYVRLRRHAEAVERQAKDAKRVADEQKERLWDFLEAAGVKTISHDLGRVTRTVRTVALVTDAEALTTSLEAAGVLDAFTKVDFRKAQLNEYAKESLEEGAPLPDGLDTLSIKQITFTPAKGA